MIGTGQGFIIVDNIRYSGEVSGDCPDVGLVALLPTRPEDRLPARATARVPSVHLQSRSRD